MIVVSIYRIIILILIFGFVYTEEVSSIEDKKNSYSRLRGRRNYLARKKRNQESSSSKTSATITMNHLKDNARFCLYPNILIHLLI